MKLQTTLSILIAFPFAISASALALADPAKEIRKPISAEVSVDADGRITQINVVDKQVGAGIKAAVEQRLRNLRFAPATANGVARPASTYVALDVCASPSGDGYKLAVNIASNGPLLTKEDRFEFPYALDTYGNAHLYAVIKLRAKADGHAELVDVQNVDVAPAVEHDLHVMAKTWVATLRCAPERVGGQPVATDIQLPVEWFKLDSGPHGAYMRPLPAPHAGNDPSCKTSRMPNDIPSQIDSPLKMLDEPTDTAPATP